MPRKPFLLFAALFICIAVCWSRQLSKTSDDYYKSIDVAAAFPDIDVYLPTYPCDQNVSHIPDVYSTYCWSTDKVTPGGECGNYKKEGDCFNREHLWPKAWFGGFDMGAN
eukprot:gene44148-53971_t